jgi:curli biogenesis system outer membrane secretion channel CsgG
MKKITLTLFIFKFLLTGCLQLVSFPFLAQNKGSIPFHKLDSTAILAVVPFKEAFEHNDDNMDYSKIMAERTLTAVEQSRRFIVIDRTDFQSILDERVFQDGENKQDFEDLTTEDLARLGKRLRADFILTGTISNVGCSMTPTGSFRTVLGFTIKVINVYTGKIYVTESFEVTSGSALKIKHQYNSCGEAISAIFVKVDEPVKLFIDKYFPIYAKYVRTEKKSKINEMVEALIEGGAEKGFRLSQKLDILVIDMSPGNKLPPEDVGDAEIIGMDPSYSTVRIKSLKRGLEALENKENILYFRSKSD